MASVSRSDALTAEEVRVLSDPDRSLVEAGAWYESVANSRYSTVEERDAAGFEESLRLKSKLDEVEERGLSILQMETGAESRVLI